MCCDCHCARSRLSRSSVAAYLAVISRRARRERRVDEDREVRRTVLPDEIGEHVQHFLRPPHGECRNHDIPARQRRRQHLREFVVRRRQRLVQAVAIRRFDDEDVGFGDRRRVIHHRPAGLTQIAREHQLALAARRVDPQFEDRRAENVPRIAEPETDRRRRLAERVVTDRPQLSQASLGIGHRLQRHDGAHAGSTAATMAGACAVALRALLRPLGVEFLDMRAVGEHHAEQVDGRRSRVDRAAEAARRQARQQPRMVDMRVGDDDEINRARVEVERAEVLVVGVAAALKQPAIDQESGMVRVDAKAGAGDLFSRAKKPERRHRRRAHHAGRVAGAARTAGASSTPPHPPPRTIAPRSRRRAAAATTP